MNKNDNEQSEPWVGGLIGGIVGIPIALYGGTFAAIIGEKTFDEAANGIMDQFVELGQTIDRKYGKDIKSAIVQVAVSALLGGIFDGGGAPPPDSKN